MAHRRVPQAVDVIGRWLLESASHNHSETVSNPSVAWRAIDVVSLLAAQNHRFIHRNRERLDVLARRVFTFIEGGILIERAPRDRPFHRLPFAAAIREK